MTTQQPQSTFSSSNQNDNYYINYAINNMLLQVNTMFPAKIITIVGNTCTIEPIILLKAVNQQTPLPPTIESVPLGYLAGGNAGFIVNYQELDVVMCGAIMRDISNIKKNWQPGLPASNRKFSISDAVVMFKLTNTLPTTYVKATDNGIEIKCSGSQPINVITSGQANIDAAVVKLGNSANKPVLLENVAMTANIAGVQPGSGVSGVTVTITSGGSSKVEAAT